MNQQQYLDALKKALKGIDRKSRNNILLEIKSLISELSTQESIEAHFGTPTELATQYLEGEKIAPTVGKKIMGIGKNIFVVIGIGITLLILGIILTAWYFSNDHFNYADTSAKELNKDGTNWHSVEWNSDINIDVEQGRAVIYWHDQASINWNCGDKQNLNPTANKILKIRHDQCILFLPKQALTVKGNQSDIVLVKPENPAKINLRQSKLRIAKNGGNYKLQINAVRSAIGDLSFDEKASIVISIDAEESQIERYEY